MRKIHISRIEMYKTSNSSVYYRFKEFHYHQSLISKPEMRSNMVYILISRKAILYVGYFSEGT